MDGRDLIFLIPIVAILGAFAVGITAIVRGSRLRELKIRERIAMIEKGLVPPPEVDPAGFDRAMGRYERSGGPGPGLRRAGIMVMSVGLGMMVLISVAGGSVRAGIGVGGFLVIVGLAFLINSLFEPRHNSQPAGPSAAPPTPPFTE